MTTTEYHAELSKAEHTSITDWNSPEPDRYELKVGRLILHVVFTGALWRWDIVHERSGKLQEGESESLHVAGREAITYAKHLVKQKQLAGLQSL